METATAGSPFSETRAGERAEVVLPWLDLASTCPQDIGMSSSVSRGRVQISGAINRTGPFSEGTLTDEGGGKGPWLQQESQLLEQRLQLGLRGQQQWFPFLYQRALATMCPKPSAML